MSSYNYFIGKIESLIENGFTISKLTTLEEKRIMNLLFWKEKNISFETKWIDSIDTLLNLLKSE